MGEFGGKYYTLHRSIRKYTQGENGQFIVKDMEKVRA